MIPDIGQDEIKKLINGKLIDATREELKKHVEKAEPGKKISQELLELLKKLFGDFELIF
jgi:hypothetical protein